MNSYWIDSTKESNFDSLKNDETFDVCIIGGGLTGIATAYMLKDSRVKNLHT